MMLSRINSALFTNRFTQLPLHNFCLHFSNYIPCIIKYTLRNANGHSVRSSTIQSIHLNVSIISSPPIMAVVMSSY